MKRVKAACIFQTLIFSQKPEAGCSKELARKLNRTEVDTYKASLDRSHTRYQITQEQELEDGSVLLRIRKQYNDTADVSEYFQ